MSKSRTPKLITGSEIGRLSGMAPQTARKRLVDVRPDALMVFGSRPPVPLFDPLNPVIARLIGDANLAQIQ